MCSALLLAQPVGEGPDSEGDIIYKKAKSFLRTGPLDSIIHYLKLSQVEYKKEGDAKGQFECFQGLWNMSNLLKKYEEAHGFVDSMQMLPNNYDLESDEEKSILGFAFGYRGLLYYKVGKNDAAEKEYQIAVDQLNSMDSIHTSSLVTKMNNLAIVYNDKGDYEKANSIYNRALEILQITNIEEELFLQGSAYNNLGQLDFNLGNYENALSFFQLALQKHQHYKSYVETEGARRNISFPTNHITNCNNLGKTFLQLNQLDSAKIYLELAGELQEEYRNNNPADLTNMFLGRLYLKQNDRNKGIKFLDGALQQALEQYALPHKNVARCYLSLAEAYEDQKDWEQALAFYLKSTEALVNDSLINDLPSSLDNVASSVEMLNTLAAKAALLYRLALQNPEQNYLTEAFRHYEFIDELINYARQSYLEENSKHYLAERGHEIYGLALKTTVALFKQTQEKEYLQAAFNFMENNKATTLLETLAEGEARMFTGLRQTELGQQLLTEEEALKKEITNLRRLIYEAGDKKSDKTKKFKADLFDRKEAFEKVRKRLEEAFPDYYKFKYERTIASIEQLQREILGEQEVLIEYYLNNETLITLLIGSGFTLIDEKDISLKDQQALESFLQQISSFSFIKEGEMAFRVFTEAAYQLYQLLIEDIKEPLNSEITQLIIIPDGQLNFVSFPALLKELPSDRKKVDYSPENLNYLIEDYQIRYAYSANQLTFYQKKIKSNKRRKGFLGFAPSFGEEYSASTFNRSCGEGVLSPLNQNEYEVREIANMINGKSYTGSKANSERFKKLASQYKILHLATHACSQTDKPLYHKIYFGQEDYLYTFDLYDLDIAADLVVLSACETGIGQVVEGEGVLSLARGFVNAGSQSILTTLWSVSDKTTANIMIDYYDQLKRGLDKSAALRNAQLNFLQNQEPKYMHPVYWAGFVQMGLDDSLEFQTSTSSFYLYILIAIVGIFIVYFLRRRVSAPA